jgi:hypothetical protein
MKIFLLPFILILYYSINNRYIVNKRPKEHKNQLISKLHGSLVGLYRVSIQKLKTLLENGVSIGSLLITVITVKRPDKDPFNILCISMLSPLGLYLTSFCAKNDTYPFFIENRILLNPTLHGNT